MSSELSAMPPAIILCGGEGTRIRDATELLPKPMVPVGPHPLVWHIMKTYASYGVERFVLCLGHKREVFIDYFLHYHARATDLTVRLGRDHDVTYHDGQGREEWEVTLADTGVATMTGGRVARAARYLEARDEHFFLTYGDGLANVDIRSLYDAHLQAGREITVTAVHPAGRFGEMVITDDRTVSRFHEKPQTESGRINGGFMVLKKSFIERYLTTDEALILEIEPMRNAVSDGDMVAHEHNGFWQCMDTARENALLNALWDKGEAPWTENW